MKLYVKAFSQEDGVSEHLSVEALLREKKRIAKCLFVLDSLGCCKGILEYGDIKKPFPDASSLTAGDICRQDGEMLTASSVHCESVRKEAALLLAASSRVYLPVIDERGRPAGLVYRRENSLQWNRIAWDAEGAWDTFGDGEAWSAAWGSSEKLWRGSLLPRIGKLLPAESILEIAPGHGRFSRFLIPQTERYRGVELSGRCRDFCRRRFASAGHAAFFRNDGMTLPMIEDRSCRFIFSFDSLVHAEMDVMESYIGECLRVLAPGGTAFLHHSHMGAFSDPMNCAWRAYDVSAASVRAVIEKKGGAAFLQECVNWIGEDRLTDCFTFFTDGSGKASDFRLIENPRFAEEAERARNRDFS